VTARKIVMHSDTKSYNASEEEGLAKEGSFKAAEARYTAVDQVDTEQLARWLAKSREIQWDYKNLIRRKGRLERLRSHP
jgi:hypothetical protein